MKSSSSVIKKYNALSRYYDRLWASYVQASITETLKCVSLPNKGKILDVGCGTGTFLQALSEKFPDLQLFGVDLSLGMLEKAKNKLQKRAVFSQANAGALPFENETFDYVLSTNSFHYWANTSKSFQEIKRVLKRGGIFVLTDWCSDFWTCRTLGLFLRVSKHPCVKIYTTTDFQMLFSEAEFKNILIRKYKLDFFWGLMTATGQKISALEETR